MAISIFLRSVGAFLAYTARESQVGTEPIPHIASAEFFKKYLLEGMKTPRDPFAQCR
jgi:hypothetical protein